MIKNLKLSELELNSGQLEGLPKNPRFIRDERFEKLKKSIEEAPEMLALRELLVYPLDSGKFIVIGGNMRLRACKDLGYKELPCKVIAKETPVEKLREYTIKDNVAFGQEDWDVLANDWDAKELDDWGLDVWQDETQEHSAIDEDEAPEVDTKSDPKTKIGDIWQLGRHRLMCGDSTDSETVTKLMGGVMADLYLSDPPYNVAYEGGTKDALTILNDSMSDNDFRTFLCNAFKAVDNVLKPGASFYIWHADSEGYNFRGACYDTEWKVRQCLIWNKNCMVMGRQDYQWKHEPCLYGWKSGASHTWQSDRKQTTVIDFNKPTRNGEHPTMKPVGLMGYLIENSTKPNQVVVDTFGGSGTTLIACQQLERVCYMMELDPRYCDVILKRWEDVTGEKATLVGKP